MSGLYGFYKYDYCSIGMLSYRMKYYYSAELYSTCHQNHSTVVLSITPSLANSKLTQLSNHDNHIHFLHTLRPYIPSFFSLTNKHTCKHLFCPKHESARNSSTHTHPHSLRIILSQLHNGLPNVHLY